eukprot:SAG31_NODE_2303_length_5975_cov_2.694860_2_plen_623_part_00
MQELWLDILQVVTTLSHLFLNCYAELRWPPGCTQSECERSLLDAVKLVIPLLQASETSVRDFLQSDKQTAMLEGSDSKVLDSALCPNFSTPTATVRSYLTSLHCVLCSVELPRECTMAAAAAWIKLLSFAGPVKLVVKLLSTALKPQEIEPGHIGPTVTPWVFYGESGSSFASIFQLLPAFTRLSVVRGMLASLRLSTLSHQLDEEMQFRCLHDTIFEMLIKNCSDSADHHLRFHAMNTLHICLQQTVTRVRQGSVDLSLMSRKQDSVLNVIWTCLEDPSSGIAARVQELFDYLLKVKDVSVEDPEAYWATLTRKFLDLSWKRKGKYAPLISITKHIGAPSVIAMHGSILRDVIFAMAFDPVASASASLLEVLLTSLRKSVLPELCLQICVPPVWEALSSSDPKVQSNALCYALPLFLKRIPDSLGAILDTIRNSAKRCNLLTELWALVAVLHSARSQMSLGDMAFGEQCDYGHAAHHGPRTYISYAEMRTALTSVDGVLRMAALELLCVCYKTTMEIADTEYELLRIAIPLTLSLDHAGLQSRCRALLQKLFVRLHQSARQSVVQAKPDALDPETVTKMKSFISWLVRLVVCSICPGASYQRKSMALVIWQQLAALFFEVP